MLQQRIQALLNLKETLRYEQEDFAKAAQRAEAENPWFTKEFIELSIKNIRDFFLDENELIAFAGTYSAAESAKTVGIVLAGNIPLVGMHDILCGVLSGHQLQIKVSSKDSVLMKFVINQLKNDNEEIAKKLSIVEQLSNCDAYIATGSNQSNVYFEQYFGKRPNILRKSRSSVALLTGDESKEELKALGEDIHYYFGLGCRNVSKLYVPKEYDFKPLIESMKAYEYLANMHKYKNNIDYNLSLLLLNQQMYMSTQSLLLVEKEETHAPISVVHYEFYDSVDELRNKLNQRDDIQALVSKQDIPFGAAQKPSLTDFADGVDTMDFLVNL
jgi:hypothetical protein